MRENILVSVCITTYNMEKYIARALESVLIQKVNFNYEIIVADDASTDNTLAILQSYQQKIGENFRIIYAEKNRGLLANFVTALQHSKGKYIASLDADDYWIDEYKIQKQTTILEENSDVGFVHSNYMYVDEVTGETNIANDKNYTVSQNNRFIKRLLYFDISVSTTCFRKNLLDFRELSIFVAKKNKVQDVPLFLSLTLLSKELYMKEPTLAYVVTKNSMSRKNDINKRIEIFKEVFEINTYFADKYNVDDTVRKEMLFNYQRKVLFASWATGDFGLIKKYAKRMSARQFIKYNPKALYIYISSKNKLLYTLIRHWFLRKRKVGK